MFPREARSTGYGTISSAFERKPSLVGRPRLDPYHKLLSRFYEPLLLLRLLGQSRGNHQPKPRDLNPVEATRRDFLRNLSYICDFEKGGDTCTAMGLADLGNSYGFFIASNKGKATIVEFLKNVLGLLRGICALPEPEVPQKEAELVKVCVDFAKKRIKKERGLLVRAVKASQQKLPHSTTTEAGRLNKWLESLLNHDDDLKFCTFVYESRHSEFLAQLQKWSIRQEDLLGPEIKNNPCGLVRHCLGRLAHHIRASKELVKSATDVSQILDNYHVSAVDHIASVRPPLPDRHTNLDGVLNRLLGKGNKERLAIEHGLSKFNAVNQVFERFPGEYRDLKPQVHAEVQILEYFHRNRIQFAEEDRFVACSKAACLCCEMYFKYHPARMIVPESHRNVWTNWGPPLVENFSKFHETGRRQLDLLNNLIREIRSLVISQALGQSSVGHRRPDSKTDITELHSFGFIPGLINVSKTSSEITGQDFVMEEQSHGLKKAPKELSMNLGALTGDNEESDIEAGGVSIYV